MIRTYELGCVFLFRVIVVLHGCFPFALSLCPASALYFLLDLLVFFARLDRLLELSARGKLARGLGRLAHDGCPR